MGTERYQIKRSYTHSSPDTKRNGFNYHYDKLTNVLNRDSIRYYVDTIQENTEIFIAYMDVNDFKIFNDRYLHSTGDKVLKEVARILKENLMDTNLGKVFRYGGDEFLFISTAIAEKDRIINVLQHINEKLERDTNVPEAEITPISISIGTWSGLFTSLEDIIDAPDRALSYAKTLPNHLCDYDEYYEYYFKMSEFCKEYNLDNIQIFFQPIINTCKDTVIAAEVLSRMIYDNTILLPEKYMEHLEKHKRMHTLDICVVKKTCKYIHSLKSQKVKNISFAINISLESWKSPSLPGLLDMITSRYEVKHRSLILEIPEYLEITNDGTIIENIQQLHQRNYQIALDDFGGGYANYNAFLLPIDWIKIDRSMFHFKIALKHIIRMIKDYKFKIILEGIETNEELIIANQENVIYMQGFYFSKVLSEDDFTRWLKKNGNGLRGYQK